MFSSTISRWTMLHFAAATALFLVAQVAMAAGAAYPVLPLSAPATLAVVHLLTVGWITLLMLGALHQFVPVITAQTGVAGISALVSLIAILAGLAGMEAGFLSLAGQLPLSVILALPLGGTLVLAGVIAGVIPLAKMLWQTRPLPFAARFVAVGLAFLFATIAAGLVMGLAFARPDWISWPEAFSRGLQLHLMAGLLGWFMLTAMGVSYRLLTMFTLAPEERGPLGTAVLGLSAGGLAATWLLSIAAAAGAPVAPALIAATASATVLGVALYFVDMVRLYRARRRNKLELNTGMARAALVAFALGVLLAVWMLVSGNDALIGPLAYLFVFGWLSGLGLSQLYKIVPFLTWLERYGSVLGKQPVPRVQDLVDEERDEPWFILYFGGVAAGTVFGLMGWQHLWRIAIISHLVASLLIARALWIARRGTTSQARPGRPVSGTPAAAPSLLAPNLVSSE